MKKCIKCGTPHKNKTEESKYEEIGDVCLRCESIIKMISSFELGINLYVPLGETRPRRKLTILDYKIEKI